MNIEHLNENGTFPDGKFLVRAHSYFPIIVHVSLLHMLLDPLAGLTAPSSLVTVYDETVSVYPRVQGPLKPNEYILSVCYKGNATHHLMAANENGVWTVNKKAYGDATSMEDLVELLKTKPSGWPVALGNHAPVNGDGTPRADNGAAAKPKRSSSTESAGGREPWMLKVNKEKAEELLAAGGKDGQFLVRGPSKPGVYVLSITFRGKPTHHKLAPNEDGVYTVNGKIYGTPQTSVEQLILEVAKKPKGWPVAFAEYATLDGQFKSMSGQGSSNGATKPPSADRETKPKVGGGGGTKSSGKPPYVYGPLTKAVAEKKLTSFNSGANADGTFLIRRQPNDEDGNNFVLSVIYKGKPTHHKLFRESKSHPWTVNKTPCQDITSIPGVVKHLQTKKSWWPVPLTTPVAKEGGVKSSSTSKSAAPKATKATPTSTAQPSWLVDTVKRKDEAAETVTEYCGGDISGKDGTFCVWPKPNTEPGTSFVVSVVYRSQMTHHAAKQEEDGKWTINKKNVPDATEIADVVRFLENKHPFWPVPLTNPVGAKETGGVPAQEATHETTSTTEAEETKATEEEAPAYSEQTNPPTSAQDGDVADMTVADSDGLPAPVNQDSAEVSALILDDNGAPVVLGGSEEPEQPEEPSREFEGGSYEDKTLTRESLTSSFGLQVQEAWLGVGRGHAVVVSHVFPGSPAEKCLKVDDILVKIDNLIVERYTLEPVKEVLRELGLSAEIKVYRRRNALPYQLQDTPTVNPIVRKDHIAMQTEKSNAKSSKAAKETLWSKPAKGKKSHRNVSSIWDGTYDDGYGMTPKSQEKELKRMLKNARRSGSRLDVVVTRHAIIDPSASKTPQYTTA